jgi:hypothetical protein
MRVTRYEISETTTRQNLLPTEPFADGTLYRQNPIQAELYASGTPPKWNSAQLAPCRGGTTINNLKLEYT